MFRRRKKQVDKDYGLVDGTVEEMAVALALTMIDVLHTLSPTIRAQVASRIRENQLQLGNLSYTSELVTKRQVQRIRTVFMRACE